MKQKNIDRDMMRDVLTDMDFEVPKEKVDVAPKMEERPKLSASQHLRPAVLTVAKPPSRGKVAKIAFASVLLLALGWAGIYSGIGRQLAFSIHDIVAAVKSSVVPPAPGSVGPTAPASPYDSSPSPTSETPNNKNQDIPQQGGAESSISSPEHN
jgi:hypothetical protein